MTQSPVGGSSPLVGSIIGMSGSSGPTPQLSTETRKTEKDCSSGRLKKIKWQVVLTNNNFDLLDQDVKAMHVSSMDQPQLKRLSPKPKEKVKLMPKCPPENGK